MEQNENVSNLPSIQVNVPSERQLIPDQKIVDYYDEVIKNLRDDRVEADEMYRNFATMVIDDGDASSASKEALVNLLKLKTEANDRMIKVLDLWTRMALKEKDTFPRYMAVQQNNKIEAPKSTRKLIEMINQMPREETEHA